MKHYYYTDEFLEHLAEPHNVGVLENPDGYAVERAPSAICGDTVRMMISVNGESIADIKYKVYGCAVVIAGCSMLSFMVKGKPIVEVEAISVDFLAEKLGGIPSKKEECLGVAIGALKSAIKKYRDGLP
ncbi:iron-sulfur cluster assembly scaffold protein [bacterium]|nr:iron-sulfur cluster assembly scaffold protein [bacterium]MBU1024800.1 iron-sulfur cluster assembly scaffold protein [bacterium]